MASRKEYEMLFSLNARMNGGFGGTFSKAQAEFSRLGKEVSSLQKLQGDVASYQKQQSAIDTTRSKLENLKQQHDLLQKEISETTEGTASLEREKLKLEQRIKDTEAALSRQEQRLESTGARLKEAGVDTSNLSQKDAELTAKIKELRDQQDKAADSAEDFGEKASQAIGAVGQALAAAGIAVALKKVSDAFVECVGVAADFEQTMSTVEALSQANEQDMAALAAQAKELGATTKFTAKEAGDAMGYMAMAGWDAKDMLQGMDGVLQLAAASGEDLAMVSDIVTDSLSAFGLTAKDTAHFSDVLAAAATNSNTNVAIMGETFKMSASVAGALGYSIEDVAVAMGLMANSGVKGSIAGTALRNTFNGLLEGVTLTGAAFGEYEYSAVRADGTMKDFGSTIDELRGYFEQMTEAERVNNAQAIAGQRGYNGLLAILNATDADYAKLTASINNCSGAAERMASIKMDNLNGQLTLMNSAWDALKTTIGEEFNPELRSLAEIGTDLLTMADAFVREHPALVKGAMAGAGAFLTLGTAVVGVNAALTAFKALKVAALFTGPAGAAIGLAAAVAGLTAVVVGAVTATNDGVASVKELTEAARDMHDAMKDAEDTYAQTATQVLATAEVAGVYIDKLEELGEGTEATDDHSQTYLNTLALLSNAIPELADYIDLETGAIKGGTEALREHTEAWKKDAETQAYQEYINSLMGEYNSVMTEAAANSIKLTQAEIKEEAATKGLEDTYQKLLAALGMTDEQFRSTYHTVQDIPYRAVSADVAALRSEYLGYEKQLSTAQKEQRNLNKAIEEDAAAVAAAEAEIESARAAVEQLTGVTKEQAEAEAEAARQTQMLNGVIGETMEQVASLAAAYEDAYTAAKESFEGQFGLFDEAKADADATIEAAQRALDTQLAYWQGYAANIEFLRKISAEDLGVTQENYNALMEYIRSGTPEAAGLAADMVKAVNDGNTQALTNLAETLGQISESQGQAEQAVAEWTVGLTEQMDQLIHEMEEDIEAMDLGNEAKAAGRATIQGYLDAATEMMPDVQIAYTALAAAARKALVGTYTGSYFDIPGHAAGTENAAPGFALVGEHGPEVVAFNGGEKVLNANKTSALLRASAISAEQDQRGGGGNNYSVPVTINVSGNATPDALDYLREYGDKLSNTVAEMVRNTLEDERHEARRRAYI